MSIRTLASRGARFCCHVGPLLLAASAALAQQPADGGIEAYSSMEDKGQALNYVIALVLTVLAMLIAFKKPDRVADHD